MLPGREPRLARWEASVQPVELRHGSMPRDLVKSICETGAITLSKGIWGRSIFQAVKFIQFYKYLLEARVTAKEMFHFL
jgi:hypothetical protein